jgi:hypothetical protein
VNPRHIAARATLLALLAALCCLVLPAIAGAADLGPAPVRCGGENGGTAGGCYGTSANVMDDTWLADLTVSPHVVHVGEKITATVAPLRDRVQWTWGFEGCAPNTPVCTFTATTPTNGWALLGMSFPSPYGVGIEQDFYAVLQDLYAITGYVRDAEGKGVAGATVTVAGKGGGAATTNVNGYYTTQVPKGSYAVSAAGGYCVVGVTGCATSRALKTPGSKTVDFAPAPRHRLEGTVTAIGCGENACSAPKGVPNVTVTAKAIDGGETMTATTGDDGTYSLDLLEGTYDVTPKLDDRTFTPLDEVVRLRGDRSGVNFRTCLPEAAAARRLALANDPSACIRLYRVEAQAWIPYRGTFVDPLVTGAETIPGTDYPVTATSPSILTLSGGWPACGDGRNPLPGIRQIDLKKAKATVKWRSRYLGHGHAGYGGGSLGGVNIPVLWDGAQGQLHIVQGQTQELMGTLTRVYDYEIVKRGQKKPSERRSCTMTRNVVAAYTARLIDKDSVEILVSWQMPFKTAENIDDVLAAVDKVPKPDKVTKKAAEGDWKAIEKLLERSDRWNALPDGAKAKFGKWARGQLEKGYAKAKVLKQLDGVLDMLGKDVGAVVGHPVLKMSKKYVEILKEADYPSFDLRLEVSFETTSGLTGGHNTTMTVQAAADDFPSYGVQVLRREDGEERMRAVAWPPTGGVLDPAGRMSKTGAFVLVDPSTVQVADGRVSLLRQDRLLGGPGAKLSLVAAMNVINNPIAHDTPIVGGQMVGGVFRTLTWSFPGSAS